MKNNQSTHIGRLGSTRLTTCLSMCAALSFGFCLTWFSHAQYRIVALSGMIAENATSASESSAGLLDDQTASPESIEEPATGSSYVQEPLTRSAFRPNPFGLKSPGYQRNNYTMLQAFSHAVGDARMSTVRLVDSVGDRLALGAIVDSEGWIATKASQLPPSGTVIAKLADNTELVAEVVEKVSDVDLALLRVNRSGLVSVPWAASNIPTRGSWLATTDIGQMPSAVGVVSAGIQSVMRVNPVLGVELHNSHLGAAVRRVLYGTGADLAGLQVGDVITEVNYKSIKSQPDFQSAIGMVRGGEVVHLMVNRGERKFEVDAQLMDLSDELLDETEMEVNGPVSARSTGFSRVFLHDTVLNPTQCGGPICNLDGQVVGLNIARAGRVSSYALPVDVVRPLLESMIAQAKLVSRPLAPSVDAAAVR